MNANELDKKLVEVAKFIDSVANNWQAIRTIESTRTMLRQQQAEIEALKAKLQLHEAMDNQCASLMQQFRKASEK